MSPIYGLVWIEWKLILKLKSLILHSFAKNTHKQKTKTHTSSWLYNYLWKIIFSKDGSNCISHSTCSCHSPYLEVSWFPNLLYSSPSISLFPSPYTWVFRCDCLVEWYCGTSEARSSCHIYVGYLSWHQGTMLWGKPRLPRNGIYRCSGWKPQLRAQSTAMCVREPLRWIQVPWPSDWTL